MYSCSMVMNMPDAEHSNELVGRVYVWKAIHVDIECVCLWLLSCRWEGLNDLLDEEFSFLQVCSRKISTWVYACNVCMMAEDDSLLRHLCLFDDTRHHVLVFLLMWIILTKWISTLFRDLLSNLLWCGSFRMHMIERYVVNPWKKASSKVCKISDCK